MAKFMSGSVDKFNEKDADHMLHGIATLEDEAEESQLPGNFTGKEKLL